ncbi:MAG: DUF1553 domain-containing protein, partial [Planctomycetales bacterium]|nr:DUF1553 domain-containing protein [Planctomycetales bacterium]
EYYQLFAFFNNADEANHNLAPTVEQLAQFEVATADHRKKLEQKKSELAELTQSCGEPNDEESKSKEDTEKRIESLSAEIEKLTKSPPKQPTFPVRVVRQRDKDLRSTHILRRGEFKQPMDEVHAKTLSALPHSSDDDDPERLKLAKWMVSGNNPLVPRVAVNHIWQKLFGAGLVTTVNDFGVRGDQPSHPELVDYLAHRYVELGWSRKALIREIVLSATYQQSSDHRPELASVDPNNRLLYRQNRFRVEAETLRDITLSVANLLSNRIGGPSVFPPMPPEAAAVSYASNFKWKTSPGADRYRRGLYTFFKRTAPHPTLMTFDCPDANVTNVQRNRSNTPIGALVLLNNEVYSEAAAAMAGELLATQADSDSARIELAFRKCISRRPSDEEITQIEGLLDTAREYYGNHPEDTAKVLGDHQRWDATEHAAWAATVRVILNLDEFITRD